MPNLENMTLAELTALADKLSGLGRIGLILAEHGFAPEFDLSPGHAPAIALHGWQMPHAWTADEHRVETASVPYAWSPETGLVRVGPIPGYDRQEPTIDFEDLPPSPPAPSGDSAAAAATAAGNEPADDAPAAAVPHAAAGVASEDPPIGYPADPDPIPEPPAAPPPAAGVAETAPEQAAPIAGAADPARGGETGRPTPAPAASTPAPWTAEEEDRLIEATVAALQRGLTRASAMAHGAAVIGRPYEGVKSRLYNQLKHRLAAAEAAITTETPMLGGERGGLQRHRLADEAPVQAAEQKATSPNSAAEATPSTLPAFLATRDMVTKGQRWTTTEDRDLMQMNVDGLDQNSIALDLDVPAHAVKARFDYLTGLRKTEGPDSSKLVRTFGSRDVLAALIRTSHAHVKAAE